MTLFGTFGALLPLPDLTDHSIFVAFGGKKIKIFSSMVRKHATEK